MSSADLKLDLFRKLDQLNATDLTEAYGVILNYINTNRTIDEWEELSLKQRNAIKEGLKQLDDGEGRSHTDVLNQFRSRFLDV